jgi:hypothetical protein
MSRDSHHVVRDLGDVMMADIFKEAVCPPSCRSRIGTAAGGRQIRLSPATLLTMFLAVSSYGLPVPVKGCCSVPARRLRREDHRVVREGKFDCLVVQAGEAAVERIRRCHRPISAGYKCG